MKPFEGDFFSQILDNINDSIYITDVETDEIVYANRELKESFGIEKPEGSICWKVLQKDMDKRCDFCHKEQLLEAGDGAVCQWKERSALTGRLYQNYDRIIEWKGKKYHIQHAVDITDHERLVEEARIDELTGILNRRAGKEMLAELLESMEDEESLVVMMLDVNGLKRINDQMGHLEGDRMLIYMAKTIQENLDAADFLFRLSGDEFIAVLRGKNEEQSRNWERQVKAQMELHRKTCGISYPVSFSSGLVRVFGRDHFSVSDIFSRADLRMYINKQKFYVQVGQEEMFQVFGRTAGKEHLEQAVLEAKRQNVPLATAILDADNLKKINDSYGTEEGDAFLLQLVEVIKEGLEKPDFMFRLNGDEFMLVLPGKREQEVKRFLTESRKKLERLSAEWKLPYERTFTYGVYTVWPEDTLSVGVIIAKADERMYAQKLRRRKTRLVESEEAIPQEGKILEQFEYDSSLLYEALVKSTDDFVYLCDYKTMTFRYSPAQVYHFDLPGEIIKEPMELWKGIVHPEDWPRFYKSNMEIGENMIDYHSVEFRARNRSGEYQWLRCRGKLMRNDCGEPTLFAGVMTLLGKQNKIDPMTQLLNQSEFLRVCDQKIHDRRFVEQLAVMILDLDDFKQINEAYDVLEGGHALKTMAQSIQSILPDNAGLFRLDGDWLGILFENASHEETVQLYKEIRNLVVHMDLGKELRIPITVSAGCVMYPEYGRMTTELYKYADYALTYAKEQGKGRMAFFSRDILVSRRRNMEMMMDLRESVDHGFAGFSLRFQPQVDAEKGMVMGAEVLLRWMDAKGDVISPGEFVPILEESGMIHEVGRWVLYKAMETAKSWLSKFPSFNLCVNISALQLTDSKFADRVLEMVEQAGYPCENLTLELTESCSIQEAETLDKKFGILRKKGIRVALDDFGTGYSSLERLKFAPVDMVKIDRVFLKNILSSEFDRTFIRFVVAICHAAGLQVCLEGLETAEEYEAVRNMGLDCIQGFFFGMPMKHGEFKLWLESKG